MKAYSGNQPACRKMFLALCILTLLVTGSGNIAAQTDLGMTTYMMPPAEIAALIDAPQTPVVAISPDNEWMLLMHQPNLPPIEEVAQPELRLAGIRINPRINGRSRGRYYNGLTWKKISDGSEITVGGLPENPKISYLSWSPDGRQMAFINTTDSGLELWRLKLKDNRAVRVSAERLNAVFGWAYDWQADSKGFVVRLVPAERGPAPEKSFIPAGPAVQENIGRTAPARTYQDLLHNDDDAALFDHYAVSQIARVDFDGRITPLGRPGVHITAELSPDGKYLLVETVHRPYSYTLPYYRFPRKVEVWNTAGEVVYEVTDRPLADQIPIAFGSVMTGPRGIEWRADVGSSLFWTEALDGGDAGAEAEWRDQVMMLPAPFDTEPVELSRLSLRYEGVTWGDNNLAIVTESWWPTRWTKSWVVRPGSPQAEPRLLFDRSWEDRYNNPGMPLTERTKYGTGVIQTADRGRTMFLSGTGASPEGNRPFLDAMDLSTFTTTRLFRSEAPYYESITRVIDKKRPKIITRRESINEPPNYYIRDLKKQTIKQLTEFPHPTPQLAGVTKEIIKYTRDDSLPLTANLYLPPGYDPGNGPLPMLMWAYPAEYKDANAAGQVRDSPYRFLRVGWYSPVIWLTRGYAVLDRVAMPIVGEGDEEPNDTFIEQLVANARAAIDEVVRRGVADRDRIAIGGHSYGAFMTANLLAHCDLFRAGLARSGAYNRTLTPFGFQAEERTLWDAPEIYFAMSPFMHADKIDEPFLMVHGEADNNAGTFPLQSERLYGALKGHGATVRLVMLPHESHSYRARESIMHLLWETSEWMDRYVMEAAPRGGE